MFLAFEWIVRTVEGWVVVLYLVHLPQGVLPFGVVVHWSRIQHIPSDYSDIGLKLTSHSQFHSLRNPEPMDVKHFALWAANPNLRRPKRCHGVT